MKRHGVRPLATALALGAALWFSVSWAARSLTSAAPRGRPFIVENRGGNAPGVLGPQRPEDVVNLFGRETLAPDDAIEIFRVPEDQWFIVTEVDLGGSVNFPLVEIWEEEETVKLEAAWTDPTRFFSSVGLTFRPGSAVTIRRSAAVPGFAAWLVVGYLVPAARAAEE